ncbi:50S ribosomal protein L13 [Candidatus Uhrbacteria bacterium]|nr:50S ribosomal protein L13 [Candidatus Uhrbacteria bacterium]
MTKTKIIRDRKVIDGADRPIGRLASEVASILQGKSKPTYEPNVDHGDFVEIRNSARMKVTGNKLEGKFYYRYSGYPGGMRKTALKDVIAKDPGEALRRAVRSMLPENRLRQGRMKRLIIHKD